MLRLYIQMMMSNDTKLEYMEECFGLIQFSLWRLPRRLPDEEARCAKNTSYHSIAV